MRAVNLLPSDSDRRREAESRTTSGRGGFVTTGRVALGGAAVAAAVCAFVGYSVVGARDDVATNREALEVVQQQVAEAETEAAAQAQQQAAASGLPTDIKAQLDAFSMVATSRVAWDVLLADVSRVVPAGAWFTSLAIQGEPAVNAAPAPTPTSPAAAPTGFVATGFALSHNTVARLLRDLSKVPMLTDVTLQRSERASVGADEAFQFTLSANVRLDGGS